MSNPIEPSLQALLDDLLARLQRNLGENLVGVYVYGSLVWGDYDEVSDLDVLAALNTPLDEAELGRLDTMHYAFIEKHPAFENRIEIAYVSRYALLTFKTERSPIGIISPGEPFHLVEAGIDWLMNWYFVQTYGITIWGEPPDMLIPDITHEEFMEAVYASVRDWRDRIPNLENLKWQAYAILTLCRAFYTHHHGTNVSKPVAARYVAAHFPQWTTLIENALKWRREISHTDDPEAMKPLSQEFAYFMIDEILASN